MHSLVPLSIGLSVTFQLKTVLTPNIMNIKDVETHHELVLSLLEVVQSLSVVRLHLHDFGEIDLGEGIDVEILCVDVTILSDDL